MGKTHVTFRLSEEALTVIQQHQQRHDFVERTEALEDILKQFWKVENKVATKFKRFLAGDPNIKPLEAFIDG
jgi:hypothetical protein